MNMNEVIARINELALKKKTVGLTEAELQEQQALRRQYIDEFNLKLAKLTYLEFGWVEVKNVSKDLQKIADTFKDFKTDRELYSRFSAYFNVVHNKCYNDICKIVDAMPSYNKADITEEEKEFYKRLIINNEPYRPYQE